MDEQTILLLAAPLVLAELAMKVVALVSLARQERTRGPKWVWALVILAVSTFGWIAYFLAAREET
ncbi:MAG: PLD nuclease N-terminal domain-containing protein [Myxococcota bacterium]